MPQNPPLAHRVISTPGSLPFITNRNTTDTDPCLIAGSQNILTSIKGDIQRRPGFANPLETTPTVFNNLQRTFPFERNDGTFYWMACDINSSGKAQVYKLQVGTDASFVSIFTEPSASGIPFDFIQSNNTLYFGNGVVMKKYDPSDTRAGITSGVTNWGITIGGFSGSSNNYVGTGANVTSTGNAWSNPTNFQGAPNAAYATVVLSSGNTPGSQGPNNCGSGSNQSIGGAAWATPGNVAVGGQHTTSTMVANFFSDDLLVTNFGFSIPAGATINGITASVTRSANNIGAVTDNGIFLLKVSSLVGSDHSSAGPWPTVAAAATYGSSTDLWGTSWSSSDINNSGFGILIACVNNDVSHTRTGNVYAFVTITVDYTTASTSQTSDYLEGTGFGFAVAAASTVQGIQVDVTGHSPAGSGDTLYVALLNNGNIVGNTKSIAFNTVSDQTFTFGGVSDLWGASWSAANVNASNFGVAVWCTCPAGAPGGTFAIDSAKVTITAAGAPTVSLTGTGLTAATGYQYVICYGSSKSAHLSSPTSPSAKLVPVNQSIQITLVASADPQVDQMHVYRTTDSASGLGGQSYFEIPTSPYANTSTNVTDSAVDAALNVASIAPTPTFNDPPPPAYGFVYFAGRIWMIDGAKQNKIWFTGLEEIINGVPEESIPSGIAGNFWSFDQPVQGIGVAGIDDAQKLLPFCGGRIYSLTGNTLDTFRRKLVSKSRGARNRTCIVTMGGMCAWLDSANQIWATDGNDLEELSIPIRPSLRNLTQSNCSLSFYSREDFHWLVFNTGSQTFVYDIDQEQWMPPWTFGCPHLMTGETSPGNYVLVASTAKKALTLSTMAFNDNGTTYQPIIRTMFSVVPDFGKRFSYIGMGMYNEPTKSGIPKYVSITNNGRKLSDVLFVTDDDPAQATFTSILSNAVTTESAFVRKQGQFLTQNVYAMNNPTSRWFCLQVNLARADQTDIVNEIFLAYENYR